MGNNYGGNSQERLNALLKANNMELVRQKKHLCYRHPDGRTFVTGSTPSDIHAWSMALRELERFLGVIPVKGAIGKRRKKTKVGVCREDDVPNNPFARAGRNLFAAFAEHDYGLALERETCLKIRFNLDREIEKFYARSLKRIDRIYSKPLK